MASLLELRRKAESLGIQDYGKFSKQELAEMIDKMESEKKEGESTVVEVAAEEAKEEEKAIVAEKEEAGEVEEISAEEAVDLKPTGEKKKTKKELAAEKRAEKEAAKKAKEEEKAKKKAEREAKKAQKKEKQPRVKTIFTYKPKGEKPEKLGDKSSKAYDELLTSNESCYQVAKKVGTYFSVVDKVISKYFDVEQKEVTE